MGGDWYDVLSVPGGGVGLVMGDVAGKGLAAASMVGRLRSALRAYALEGHAPGRVLEQLNRLIWTEAEESQMATLIYVVVDPGEGEVRWVNAGHPPPLLLDGEAHPQYLEGGSSVPLGVLPFPSFEEVAVPMNSGGTVVLYTDGLVERAGEHIDRGLRRLAKAVREAPTGPEELCDHVLGQLVPEGGTPDDVALLTLRTIPMTDRFEVEFPAMPEALASMRAVLRRWLRHVGGDDAGDRRDRDRMRRGGDQCHRARLGRRRRSLRGQRAGGARRGVDHHPRPRGLACPPRRRPRPRTLPDARADG